MATVILIQGQGSNYFKCTSTVGTVQPNGKLSCLHCPYQQDLRNRKIGQQRDLLRTYRAKSGGGGGVFCDCNAKICRYIDEGVLESGMGLFLIVGHWAKILPQNSKGAS
jgi:hypothetical protein